MDERRWVMLNEEPPRKVPTNALTAIVCADYEWASLTGRKSQFSDYHIKSGYGWDYSQAEKYLMAGLTSIRAGSCPHDLYRLREEFWTLAFRESASASTENGLFEAYHQLGVELITSWIQKNLPKVPARRQL
ncbi:hypothetical protein P7C70_g1996, partial [Phenoliferia sp. Uapishka_3]